MLEQIIYMSALAPHADESCLKDILAESMARNPAQHVTGLLLYVNGSFLQVVEGGPEELAELYARISKDPRHTAMAKISQHPIEEREFGDWSMGWARVQAAELDRIVGKSDFFASGHCLTELDDSLVKRVLAGFKQGQWRRRIE